VARLAGPGTIPMRGSLALDGTMRARLERGEFRLEVITRGAPMGALRVDVVPR